MLRNVAKSRKNRVMGGRNRHTAPTAARPTPLPLPKKRNRPPAGVKGNRRRICGYKPKMGHRGGYDPLCEVQKQLSDEELASEYRRSGHAALDR